MTTDQTPLNPEALGCIFATAMMEVLDAEKMQPGDRLVHVNDIQEVLNRLEKNILAALPATQPRVVTSVEELAALPDGAVVIDKHGDAVQYRGGGWWCQYETTDMKSERLAKHGLLLLVYPLRGKE